MSWPSSPTGCVRSNRLQFSAVLWCASARRHTNSLAGSCSLLTPVNSVCDHYIYTTDNADADRLDVFEMLSCYSRLSLPWCSQSSTTGVPLLTAFRNSSCMGRLQSEQNATARLISFRRWDNIQPLAHYAAYTGFTFQNGFRSSWQCWCIAVSTALHPTIWCQNCSPSQTSVHIDSCAFSAHQHSSLYVSSVLPMAIILTTGCCVCLEQSAGVRVSP